MIVPIRHLNGTADFFWQPNDRAPNQNPNSIVYQRTNDGDEEFGVGSCATYHESKWGQEACLLLSENRIGFLDKIDLNFGLRTWDPQSRIDQMFTEFDSIIFR